jgi:hypothetical protein
MLLLQTCHKYFPTGMHLHLEHGNQSKRKVHLAEFHDANTLSRYVSSVTRERACTRIYV